MTCKNCAEQATKRCPCGNAFCDSCWMPDDNLCHECIEHANSIHEADMKLLYEKAKRLDEVVEHLVRKEAFFRNEGGVMFSADFVGSEIRNLLKIAKGESDG